MSSHFEWIDEQIAKFDAEKPFAPENGEPLKFNVGDSVTFTNSYGATFNTEIVKIFEREPGSYEYAKGCRYFIPGNPRPVEESTLTPRPSGHWWNK